MVVNDTTIRKSGYPTHGSGSYSCEIAIPTEKWYDFSESRTTFPKALPLFHGNGYPRHGYGYLVLGNAYLTHESSYLFNCINGKVLACSSIRSATMPLASLSPFIMS